MYRSICILLFFVTNYCLAEQQGFYIPKKQSGIYFEDFQIQLDMPVMFRDTVFDEDGMSKSSLFSGYNLNRYFGFEFGYVDRGLMSSKPLDVNFNSQKEGFSLSSTLRYSPTEKLNFFGKMSAISPAENFHDISQRSTELLFGFGTRFDIQDNFGFHAEWEQYGDIVGDTIDLFQVGIEYKFDL